MMLIYTDHFNACKEYQRIKAADNIKIIHEDDEEKPEITQDLIGLINEEENEKRHDKEVTSLRRIREDLSSDELPV